MFTSTELEASKKQSEQDRKAIDDLVRERDILNKNLLKAAGATQKQLGVVRLHEQTKKNLEQEIQVFMTFKNGHIYYMTKTVYIYAIPLFCHKNKIVSVEKYSVLLLNKLYVLRHTFF